MYFNSSKVVLWYTSICIEIASMKYKLTEKLISSLGFIKKQVENK